MKEVKSGQRVKISTEKIDKQVHIYGVNGQAKSQIQAKVRSRHFEHYARSKSNSAFSRNDP